ncbi:molecular chaperone DnaK [Legionella sainthelensi]|nr:molecular chaperone DnaK [Legionella sainthelensi]
MLQGEREQASANKSLGRFDLSDIPSAPRGVPQIEVTFDIDANGILNVSAKDKATGKAQSIVIKASSGLSDEEVEAMVKDAKSHAEEDKKFKEMADLRNQADSLIHSCEKSMKDLATDLTDDEKKGIETAIAELKEAIQGSDKAQIEDKLKVLSDASAKMAERVYAKKASEGQAGQGQAHQEQAQTHESAKTDESVVDAEFEEVKDDKK